MDHASARRYRPSGGSPGPPARRRARRGLAGPRARRRPRRRRPAAHGPAEGPRGRAELPEEPRGRHAGARAPDPGHQPRAARELRLELRARPRPGPHPMVRGHAAAVRHGRHPGLGGVRRLRAAAHARDGGPARVGHRLLAGRDDRPLGAEVLARHTRDGRGPDRQRALQPRHALGAPRLLVAVPGVVLAAARRLEVHPGAQQRARDLRRHRLHRQLHARRRGRHAQRRRGDGILVAAHGRRAHPQHRAAGHLPRRRRRPPRHRQLRPGRLGAGPRRAHPRRPRRSVAHRPLRVHAEVHARRRPRGLSRQLGALPDDDRAGRRAGRRGLRRAAAALLRRRHLRERERAGAVVGGRPALREPAAHHAAPRPATPSRDGPRRRTARGRAAAPRAARRRARPARPRGGPSTGAHPRDLRGRAPPRLHAALPPLRTAAITAGSARATVPRPRLWLLPQSRGRDAETGSDGFWTAHLLLDDEHPPAARAHLRRRRGGGAAAGRRRIHARRRLPRHHGELGLARRGDGAAGGRHAHHPRSRLRPSRRRARRAPARGNAGGDAAALARLARGGAQAITTTATKFSTVSELRAISAEPGRAEIAAVAREGFERRPLHCAWTVGLLCTPPSLFGLPPAQVEEVTCQARGASECRYVVTWDAALAADPEQRLTALEAQLVAMSQRLDNAFATASDLVSPDDLDTVLDRIVERAGIAVRAPRYLLAVRPEEGGDMRVYARGIDDDESHALAEAAFAADGSLGDSALRAPVVSSRREYGHLLVLYPEGLGFFSGEQQLLTLYARHAAAVLDVATALDVSARRNEQVG